jgi:hypothetical protein
MIQKIVDGIIPPNGSLKKSNWMNSSIIGDLYTLRTGWWKRNVKHSFWNKSQVYKYIRATFKVVLISVLNHCDS